MRVVEVDGEFYVSIGHWGLFKLEGFIPRQHSAHRLFGN